MSLGTGTNILNLQAGSNTLSITGSTSGSTTVNGTGSDDNLTLSTTFNGAGTNIIDLGAGTDSLTLLGTGGNTLTVNNVESIVGSSGVDTITIGTAPAGAFTVNLGDGNDVLKLNNAAFSSNATINGGLGTDAIQITDAAGIADSDFTHVSSVETLTLGNFVNSVTLGSSANTAIATGTGTLTIDATPATTVP